MSNSGTGRRKPQHRKTRGGAAHQAVYPTFRVGAVSPTDSSGSAAYIGRVGVLAVALGIGLAGAAGFALPQAHADEGSSGDSSDSSSGQTTDRKDASTPASVATQQASSADTESADTDEQGTKPKGTSEPDADDSSSSAGEHTPAAGADADEDADQLDVPDSESARQTPHSSSQSRPHRSAPPAAEHERQDSGSSDSAGESASAGRATDHTPGDEVDAEAAPRPVELTDRTPVIERIDHPSAPKTSDGVDSDSDGFAVITKAIRGVLSADATSGPGSTADAALMLALLGWTRRGTKPEDEAPPQVVATTETLEDPPASEDDTVAPAAFVSARSSVTVTATTNEAPTAVDDTKTIVEDSPRTFAPSELTANDTDPEHNSPLVVDSVDNAVGGAAVLNSDGTVTFTPEANFNGAASFTYKVKDAFGAVSANSATVTVNVLGVNDAPTAAADMVSPSVGKSYTFTAAQLLGNDTDPDTPYGDSISIRSVGNATGGTVHLNGDGTVTFIPVAGSDGSGSFTYVVKDSKGAVSPAAMVTIAPVNQAPTAVNDTKTIVEDSPRTFAPSELTANDTDPEHNSPLVVDSVDNAVGGAAVLNSDGTVTFTPEANFNGAASFTYKVKDAFGAVSANSATVTVNVLGVNDAPTAAADMVSPSVGKSYTFTAAQLLGNDTDPDTPYGDSISIRSVGNATGGTVHLNGDGTVTFIPTTAFTGGSFTYVVKDSKGAVSPAAMVTIAPVNQAPTAVNDTKTIVEDNSRTFTADELTYNDIDPEHSPLSFNSVDNAVGGAVVLNGDGTVTFTPEKDFNGAASFTYTVKDSLGAVSANSAVVTVNVLAEDDVPVAGDDAYATNEDTSLTVSLPSNGLLANDTDIEGDDLTAVLVDGPSHGSLLLNDDGTFTYTPNANFAGTDFFTYAAADPGDEWGYATVTINVTAVNDAPVAANDTYTTAEDTPLSATVPGVLGNDTDVDGDALTAHLVSGPTAAQGTLVFNANGSFTFTPVANFNGVATFTYNVSDGVLTSNTATVTINVTAVNDAPVAANDTYTTAEDTPLSATVPGVLGNDTDVDGDALTASLVSGPTAAQGTLVFNANGTFTFTPVANFNGPVTFSYKVSDGVLTSNTATVTINVTAVNDAPVAVNDTYTTNEDTPLTVTLPGLGVLGNDTDAEGSALTASLVSGPTAAQGTLVFNANGTFTFTPAANFNGPVTFSYKVSDGALTSNTATVTINVTAVNDAPVAADSSFYAYYNYSIPGRYKVNSGDLRGDVSDVETADSGLTWVLVSGPTKTSGLGGNGTLTWNGDGTFSYNSDSALTPNTVVFRYKVVDPGGASSATVTVTITNHA